MSHQLTPERLSRRMSHALRHDPGKYGLQLAADGSVELRSLARALGVRVSDLEEAADSDPRKQRFEIAGGRIRALWGHTVPMKIDHPRAEPPAVLYHGTKRRAVDAIMREGLRPMGRQHVHLANNAALARSVAERRQGASAILRVDAAAASAAGVAFYHELGAETWLSGHVPPEFIEVGEWE